jgi:hypothetical protein
VPLVLFFDEIDALRGESLNTVLAQLRDGFRPRPRSFPASVALCGLRDVRDYRAGSPNCTDSTPKTPARNYGGARGPGQGTADPGPGHAPGLSRGPADRTAAHRDLPQVDAAYVQDLGLIARGNPVRAANPIYREVIARVLGASTERIITAKPQRFILPDGRQDFGLVLPRS